MAEPDAQTAVDYEVTPPDVAAVLRARTKDNESREVGLWTEATRPTVSQVEGLIEQARRLIAGTVGNPGERCKASFEQAVLYQTAMLIELSYWPEQVRTDRSPYKQLEELFTRAIEGYEACAAGSFDPDRPIGVYSVRTPSAPPSTRGSLIVNKNDPYADDGPGIPEWPTPRV
jgi:hypothetical protein